MEKDAKIFVAGHTGLVGSSIVRELARRGYNNLCLAPHRELDLRNQKDTEAFYKKKNQNMFLWRQPQWAGC